MSSLSKDELKKLLEKQAGICISLFMPTYRTGAESQQNQIRFRNLLRKTEEKLIAHNLRPQDAKAILEPALTLASNALFWRRLSDGLALFISQGDLYPYLLPLAFAESIFVSGRFHIKPLLPMLRGGENFYILALSQNSVKFLEGNKYHIKEMDVEGIPMSMEAAIPPGEPEKQIRFRTGTRGGGERGARLSGHGPEIEDVKDNILRYFRVVERCLRKVLKEERRPLLLAGVDYLFPLYKEINTYPYLVEEGIPGSPQGTNPDQMHKQAWQIVAPYFQKAENEAFSQYRQSSGTGLASSDVSEIIAAASHGRIGALFVAQGRNQWGLFFSDSGKVILQDKAEAGSEDLLDLAAIHTFLNGGSVFVVPQEKMPGQELLAAVFRY